MNNKVEIVMLGDSITAGGNWVKLLNRNDIKNHGIHGDTVGGMLERLSAVIDLKPRICFIMGGINDIARQIPISETSCQYISIVEQLKMNRIIPVIQSTLYVSNSLSDAPVINFKVKDLNQRLKSFSEQNTIHFLDVNVVLSENNGLQDKNTHDGVHLSELGYQTWNLLLRTFIKKIHF